MPYWRACHKTGDTLSPPMRDALDQAGVLGPLLKVEELLAAEIRARVPHASDDPLTLFGASGVAGDAFGSAEQDVLNVLQDVADSAQSTAAERLFAAEAWDAIRFVEAMRHRYDAVLMNPPFGEPVASTKDYIKAAYPWMPKINDLLAAFVGRGIELAKPGSGSCGAITSRAGLFLTTFSTWREEVLLANELRGLADLGRGVMEGALVEAAAYVVARRDDAKNRQSLSTCIRLLKSRDRAGGLREAIAAHRSGMPDSRVYRVDSAEFASLPGSPISYWLGRSIRRLFTDLPGMEEAGNDVFKGTSTSDDFRFVRTRWEVDPKRIGYSVADLAEGRRWAPFAKGGEYAPFWLDLDLVVDWEGGGARIKETVAEKYPYLKGNVDWVIGREAEFFSPGITWSARTMSAFSPRVLPAGAVFGHKGNKVRTEDVFSLLAWLNTRIVAALIGGLLAAGDETTSAGASKSYEIGVVRSLPVPDIHSADVAVRAQRIAECFARLDRLEETSSRFVAVPDIGQREQLVLAMALEILQLSGDLERTFASLIALDAEAADFIAEEAGIHPSDYPVSDDHDDEIERLYRLPLKRVIDELLELRGGSKAIANLTFVANRRLEVIAHGLRVNPSSIERVVRTRRLEAHGERQEDAARLVSYLIGAAFGRWDVRKAMTPVDEHSFDDLLGPPPQLPPGMLDAGAGRPSLPPDCPLSLPEDGLLIDEPGHPWNICSHIRAAAEGCFGSDERLDAAVSVLSKGSSLESYVKASFFKDHLSRYSKSRRKAPVYWPLTVPSKNWGVWSYAPTLTRETLYAIATEARRRERLAADVIARLRREQQDGGDRPYARETAEELDAEERLAEELRLFRAEAERIAGLGWQPNLDDGIVLCAAPLADLLPAWPDAKKARDELRKGQHDWAAVAQWAGEL
jgi:hypothetical protein